MSDLKFNCPHCRQPLEAPPELLGQVIDCPSCKGSIQIRKPGVRPAPQAALQNVTVEIRRGPNPLGIAALVMGIIASLTCWIPVVGLLSIPVALIGLLLGIVGFIVAAASKKTGFAFPLSGVLVCVLSVFIALAATRGCAKAAAEARTQAERTNQTVVPPKPAEAAPATPAAPKPPEPPAPIEEWTSAASAVRQGDVQVRITAVAVGKVELKDMFGEKEESKGAFLKIGVEVTNLSAAKKIDFRTWRGTGFSFGGEFAALTDDHQNSYKRVSFGSSSPAGGVESESIYPEKAIADVLVFEVPVAAATSLRLQLPAGNFGGEGMLRFEIPAGMIGR